MPAGHDYELYYCLFEGDTGGYYLASQYNVNGKWKIWEGDTNAISSLSGTVNYSKNLIVYPYNTLIWIAEIRDVKDGQVYARYWQYSNEGPNLALSPIMTVTASSEYNSNFGAKSAVDGISGVWDANEWASNGEMTPWIKLNWYVPQYMNKVVLYDRCNPIDHIKDAWLRFYKFNKLVKEIHVGMMPYGGGAREIVFNQLKADTIILNVTDGDGLNIGLSEFVVFNDTTLNIAKNSDFVSSCNEITASSEYNSGYSAICAGDGIYGAWDANEWASNGEMTP
ncbi:MAG: hypothetical protein HY776_01520 [Actinobacteria bacterium]|nr:hypothetical protein [Actinomycetota bacterium]